jgi:FMN-dependent NADH-azoreductase
MSKVLFITAHPQTDGPSHTLDLTNAFMSEYKTHHPTDEIIELNLYKENIQFLDKEMLSSMFSEGENEAKRHAVLFASCDKYVIAAPMWNLSMPAILKAYIDYIAYVGITFEYTNRGPVGLLKGKNRKVMHIVARGGIYDNPIARVLLSMLRLVGKRMYVDECGDSYLRTIMGFMGITKVTTLALEMTNMLQGAPLEKAKAKAMERAKVLAGKF